MEYDYYLNLVKAASEFESEEKFLAEIGYPAEISLDTEDFIRAIHIIFVVANGSFKELISDFKQIHFSKKFGIPHRTVQNWIAGDRNMPCYVKQLIGYAIIFDKIYLY